jgi:hypothetical protein
LGRIVVRLLGGGGAQISGDRFGMDLLLSSREAKAFGRTLGSVPALLPIDKRYLPQFIIIIIIYW